MKQSAPLEVIVVEDEPDIRHLIVLNLRQLGLEVIECASAEEAQKALISFPTCRLFIVDWMLPGLNGPEFCKQLRQNSQTASSSILMVTAKTQSEDIVQGLDSGADDYITKPFDLAIFKARVNALIRRIPMEGPEQTSRPGLHIDRSKAKVSVEGLGINLTSSEYFILSTLAKKPGHVFTRQKLIQAIQGDNIHVTSRTIDTHIAGLRKKMGQQAFYVETIRGIGYRFLDEED